MNAKPLIPQYRALIRAILEIPDPVAGKPQSTMPAYDRKWFEDRNKKRRETHEHSNQR